MIKKCLNNKGLSLVEVVMSAVIVSILMAGLYAVYFNAKNMTSLAFHKIVALAWATSYIEGEKNGMPDGSYTDPSEDNMLAEETARNASRVPDPTAYKESMIRYSVEVRWTE